MRATETLTVTEAVRNFSDYVSRVAYRHEAFVLYRGKKPVAELRPIPEGRRLGDLPGILRGLPRLTPDEAIAFGADIEAARVADNTGLRDPWDS